MGARTIVRGCSAFMILMLLSPVSFGQGIKFSGFGTITMGSTLESDKQYGFYNDDVQFKPESLAGIQVYSDIGNNTSATLQLTSRGMNDLIRKSSGYF